MASSTTSHYHMGDLPTRGGHRNGLVTPAVAGPGRETVAWASILIINIYVRSLDSLLQRGKGPMFGSG